MGISIFARRGFLGNHYTKIVPGNTILRLSGEVRGAQVAEAIGAKLNPSSGFENDLCIFVKGYRINFAKPGDYVDFSDAAVGELADFLNARQDVNIIVHSDYAFKHLRPLFTNKMVIIPQQNINWENATRKKNEKLVGGYIGRPSGISWEINKEIKATLANIGIDFIIAYEWETREDAVNFYKSIDFLVIGGHGKLPSDLWQITPAKMINAAAFGVPSLSFMRVGYEEFNDYYTQFETMDDLVFQVGRLQDEEYYRQYSERVKAKADEYHISKIAERYRRLAC